jgi:Beta-propeller repeat
VIACRISPQARYSRGALWPLLHLPRGTSFEQGLGIAVDGEGRAYVTGSTSSTDFPITPVTFDTSFDGGDAFMTKLGTD